MDLLIDPELLLPSGKDRQPAALINRFGATKTVFGYRSADPTAGPRCGRCNRLEHDHLWQLVDPEEPEQGGIIDCQVRA